MLVNVRVGAVSSLCPYSFPLGHPYPVTRNPFSSSTFRRQPLGHTIQVSSVIPSPPFPPPEKPSVSRPPPAPADAWAGQCAPSHPEPCAPWRSCIAPPLKRSRRYDGSGTRCQPGKRDPRPSLHGRAVSSAAPYK